MKLFVVVGLVALACFAAAAPQQKYTNRYDNVNIDEILINERLLFPYLKCILDQGRCSPDGKELKSHIQEALENNCGRCTDKQRSGTRQVIGHLINHQPVWWTKLVEKYDPQRKFVTKYESELRTVQG